MRRSRRQARTTNPRSQSRYAKVSGHLPHRLLAPSPSTQHQPDRGAHQRGKGSDCITSAAPPPARHCRTVRHAARELARIVLRLRRRERRRKASSTPAGLGSRCLDVEARRRGQVVRNHRPRTGAASRTATQGDSPQHLGAVPVPNNPTLGAKPTRVPCRACSRSMFSPPSAIGN